MTLPNSKSAGHSPFAKHFSASNNVVFPNEEITFGGIKMPEQLIYLDHAAATPVDNRVIARMLPWMTKFYGNPANRLHPMGEIAEHGLAQSRQTVADAVGVQFDEIFFCSSATEANNLLLRGLAGHPMRRRNKIVVAATEHSSILTTAQDLESDGIILSVLPVDANGQTDPDAAKDIIDDNTLCVCVMDVNNETGIIQKNLAEVIKIARHRGAHVHVDAVQGFARGHFNTQTCHFDTATVSGAKIYAGRGAAAFIARKCTPRIRLRPQLTGGGHESGLRSGTPNLAAIAGFAEAVKLHVSERADRLHYLSHLESVFLSALAGQIDFVQTGRTAERAAGIVMLHIAGVNAMKLIENMRSVCVSSGSACRTLQATSSHVLKAMGQEDDISLSSFRVSLGLTNTESEMLSAAGIIAETAAALRKTSANVLS
ncbi:MAG: cysteine desulfurase [Proteobacteria bacterium]|nr:cysteine desulfurase [Pseudomonadota bacterium]